MTLLRGWHGWAAVTLVVATVDALAPEGQTMSEALYRARQKHPYLVVWLVTTTAVHLLAGDHPSMARIDVFKLFGVGRRRLRTLRGSLRYAEGGFVSPRSSHCSGNEVLWPSQ
jgi:hypothetical protein